MYIYIHVSILTPMDIQVTPFTYFLRVHIYIHIYIHTYRPPNFLRRPSLQATRVNVCVYRYTYISMVYVGTYTYSTCAVYVGTYTYSICAVYVGTYTYSAYAVCVGTYTYSVCGYTHPQCICSVCGYIYLQCM